jgi:hypothetical protein
VSETAEQLSAEEVLAALEALSADDKVKLIAIERKFLGGTGRQQGELYREALCRALLGERHCPRTVPVMAFLVETMRSIASHDRKQQRRVTLLDAKDEIGEDTSTVSPGLLVSGELDPEEHLLAREEAEAGDMVTTIQGHFQGDEECQLVLMGWADGLRARNYATLSESIRHVSTISGRRSGARWADFIRTDGADERFKEGQIATN